MDIENSTAAVDTEPAPVISKPEINKEHLKKDEWLKVRFWTQTGFFVLILYIGWEFVVFVNKMAMGAPADISQRPPGIEGFLPISSMMELWLWVKTGLAPAIHPAGVVIFAFAIVSPLSSSSKTEILALSKMINIALSIFSTISSKLIKSASELDSL